MYPGDTHGIPDPRNRLVKAVAEMARMDHYVRHKFVWRDEDAGEDDRRAPGVG